VAGVGGGAVACFFGAQPGSANSAAQARTRKKLLFLRIIVVLLRRQGALPAPRIAAHSSPPGGSREGAARRTASRPFKFPPDSDTRSPMLDLKYLLCVLGMVLVLEGLPYFGFPRAMKKVLTEVIPSLPEGALRVLGLAAILFGLLLVYLGRRY
jgi:uncharacterized protein YjeT (DUF2065 family)